MGFVSSLETPGALFPIIGKNGPPILKTEVKLRKFNRFLNKFFLKKFAKIYSFLKGVREKNCTFNLKQLEF